MQEAAAKLLQAVLKGESSKPKPKPKPSKPKNKSLRVVLEEENRESDNFRWVFYETEQGETGGCPKESTIAFKGPIFKSVQQIDPGYPIGDYAMKVWGRECMSTPSFALDRQHY